jgi:predicted Zn-ribbon and HTH transcriptional regulator
MPWKCPACGTSIQHREDLPRVNVVYRCPICRLELVADLRSRKLMLAPITEANRETQPLRPLSK